MNLRPLGYEPSELPSCSTPRCLSSLPSPAAIVQTAAKPSEVMAAKQRDTTLNALLSGQPQRLDRAVQEDDGVGVGVAGVVVGVADVEPRNCRYCCVSC